MEVDEAGDGGVEEGLVFRLRVGEVVGPAGVDVGLGVGGRGGVGLPVEVEGVGGEGAVGEEGEVGGGVHACNTLKRELRGGFEKFGQEGTVAAGFAGAGGRA